VKTGDTTKAAKEKNAAKGDVSLDFARYIDGFVLYFYVF
jgi:hypothetical protein